MKKRLAALVAVLAIVAAACGGGAANNDESTTTTQAPEETPAAAQDSGGLLATVQDRGKLQCGVGGTAVAFSETQPDGSMTGFDADFCRAVAAAVLGDANAVEFRTLTSKERFEALKNKEIDVLIRNTTWTQSRDTDIGMDFGPTTYYDGQQLMGLASKFTVNSGASDVDGAILCTNAGTTTEKNITEWAKIGGADIKLETVEVFPEAIEKFKAGTCDLVTTDGSGLVGQKASNAEGVDWIIFPAAPISKEPLGPVYRQNDSQWGDVVNWVVYAMIIADEYGITSANIDDTAVADMAPELGRLFGGEGELQTAMGLSADAFYQVIKQVGNYDEVYSNNLNPVGLVREGSLNARFNEGGMIYAPPAR